MHTQDHILTTLRLEDAGVPIYVQLRDQFLRIMGQGGLKAGDQMPTMRQVAVTLKVDLNTVRHAYEDLERLGAVALIRGRGSFVAEPPPAQDGQAAAEQIDNLARRTLAAATAQGLNPFALAERIAAFAAEREGRS